MVLTLHSFPRSPPTQRVLVVVNETIKTLFEFIDIDMLKEEHLSAENVVQHPFAKCLVLTTPSFFASRARSARDRTESNSSLAPSAADLRAVAPFEQTAPVKSTQFDVPAGELVGQRMFALLFGREPFEERVKALDEALQVDLEDYERILSKTKYIGGDVLTLLNLFHLPFDELLVPAGFTWLQHEKRFPNVVRWWEVIRAFEEA